MDEVTGFVIATRSKSSLHKGKQVLEIEIQSDSNLIDWQSKKVIIKKIFRMNK